MFMLTVAAFVLLHVSPYPKRAHQKLTPPSHRFLVNFSVPLVSGFYFLSASVSGDTVHFGLWGFCFQQSGQCTATALGYKLDPEIVSWLTKLLVFFPIGTIVVDIYRPAHRTLVSGPCSNGIYGSSSDLHPSRRPLSRSKRHYIPSAII